MDLIALCRDEGQSSSALFARRFPRLSRGSALVATLLVIAVLTIIATAFLQSMTMERQTARSYLNRYKAELAAVAAQNVALVQIRQLMMANPYHGIGYMYAPDASADPSGVTPPTSAVYPVLYGAANPNATPTPHYLISIPKSEDPTIPTNKPGEGPVALTTLDNQNSVALNYKRDNDLSGWMGSPVDPATGTVTASTYRECRAPWIYILEDASKRHQPDPAQADYNPYTSRYAYWVEDETSKVDLFRAGNDRGAGGSFQPPKVENLADESDGSYKDAVAWESAHLDLGAVPIKDGKALASGDSSTNQSLISALHALNGSPKDARILGQMAGFEKSEPTARFYTTVSSVSNELAGNGRRRINLNALVHEESGDHSVIGSDVDDIAYAISGKHVIDASSRNKEGLFSSEEDDTATPPTALLALFGDRFWPSDQNSSLAAKKQQIYLIKIAANIRDYIDVDSFPTFVKSPGIVIAGDNNPHSNPLEDPAPGTYPNITHGSPMPWAIGKEAVPYLIKFGLKATYSSSALKVYQTFTFFNPSTKDFPATAGNYLRFFSPMPWTPAGGFGLTMPSYTIDLSNKTFPAGQVVVIDTSLPAWSVLMTPSDASTHSGSASKYTPQSRDGGSYDVSSKLFLANSGSGYLSGFPAVTVSSPATDLTMSSSHTSGTTGNSMQGNSTQGSNLSASRTADARSIEESLIFNKSPSSASVQDQARFYWDSGIALTSLYNKYTDPSLWPDYKKQFPGGANSEPSTHYAVIRDGPLTSIGELGNIYDPYRVKGVGSIDYARGGGRTLRIGQPDDTLKEGNFKNSAGVSGATFIGAISGATNEPRFTANWNKSAWRLTDVFDVILSSSQTQALEGKVDRTTKLVPPQAYGKLNINSVLRDNGAALRTLLRGFRYLNGTNPGGAPYTDAALVNQTLSDAEIDKIVVAVRSYLVKNGPMVERGELSQLASNNTSLFANDTLGGRTMNATQDRGREEIFRRLIGMLTTRSNSYTVYTVGQSLRDQPQGGKQTTVLSTVTKAVTYRLDPVISGKTGNEITDHHATDTATDFTAVRLYVHP